MLPSIAWASRETLTMTKAIGIAVTPARHSDISRARQLRLVLAGLGALAIAACGGGAPTTENPITNVTPPTTYSGPPPATADVQAFSLMYGITCRALTDVVPVMRRAVRA